MSIWRGRIDPSCVWPLLLGTFLLCSVLAIECLLLMGMVRGKWTS